MLAQLAIPGWLYYSALMGADLASTKIAQGRGCTEANPMVGNQAKRQVLVKGVAFTLVWGGEKIAQDHRRVRFGMRVGTGAVVALAVAHNLTIDCRPTLR